MKYKDHMSEKAGWLWAFFTFWVELFLAARFILHFFAVNPTNGFSTWIFNSTNAMMTPFRSVFTMSVAGNPHYVDFQTLFVMASYAVFALIIFKVASWSMKK